MPESHEAATCRCCNQPATGGPIGRPIARRGMLGLAASALALSALARRGWAGEGVAYDSMLLSCIDPRLVEPVHDWMAGRGLRGQYSQFIIAGAAVGVVAPEFADWRKAFWDNLATSVQLHRIGRLIAVDHRDCGAAKLAYGDERLKTPESEAALHREVFVEFRSQVGKRFPDLKLETGLMALNGGIEMFA
jgi:hypothetical protein